MQSIDYLCINRRRFVSKDPAWQCLEIYSENITRAGKLKISQTINTVCKWRIIRISSPLKLKHYYWNNLYEFILGMYWY